MKTCCELIGCPESALTERDKLIDEIIENVNNMDRWTLAEFKARSEAMRGGKG